MSQITVIVATISKTECTPWKEKALRFQHEWNYNFTGMYQVYLKLMQKQLDKSLWWTGKLLKDNKKNLRVIYKEKTLRKTKMTKKGIGIPQKKQTDRKRAKVVPANAAEMLCGVSCSSSQDHFAGIEN